MEATGGEMKERNTGQYCRTAEERKGEEVASVRSNKRTISEVDNTSAKLCKTSDEDIKYESKKPCVESQEDPSVTRTPTKSASREKEEGLWSYCIKYAVPRLSGFIAGVKLFLEISVNSIPMSRNISFLRINFCVIMIINTGQFC